MSDALKREEARVEGGTRVRPGGGRAPGGARALLSALALTVVAAVLVAGCGDGSSSSSSSSTGSTEPASAEASSTASGVNAQAVALLPEEVKSSGVLRDAVQVPTDLEFTEVGSEEFKGFDIEFAEALAESLGLELEISSVAFTQLLPSLTTGRADMVISSLNDKKERFNVASFIDYFKTGAQVFTSKENAEKISGTDGLCGETVEVAAGSSYGEEVDAFSEEACAGKSPIKVVEVGGTTAEEILQIKTGRAIAAVDTVEAFGKKKEPELAEYVPLGEPISETHYGIVVKKGNDELLAALKKAFEGMLADGSYMELLEKWGLESSAVDSVQVNTGD